VHPHVEFMSEVQTLEKTSCDDGLTWRVLDDLAHDCPVTPAELDAVEAFLMPLINALLVDTLDNPPGKTGPNPTPPSTPTHKRRNELLAEET
jgi:hypothetical protein